MHEPACDRPGLARHVQEALALDDVDDLVVGVAVVGRAADRDLAHELREPGAADVGVDEQAERAADAGLEIGLRREAHRHAPGAERGRVGVGGRGRVDDQRDERIGAVVLDRVRLARGDVGRGVGRQLVVAVAVEVERRRAREHEQRLLVARHGGALRAADRERHDALHERLAAARAVDRDARLDAVVVHLRRDVGLLHEVPGHQLASRARAAVENLPRVILEILLLGRPGSAHDRVAVEQERHAARELAVLAVVLDQPEPCRSARRRRRTRAGSAGPRPAAKQRWLSASSTLTPTSATLAAS